MSTKIHVAVDALGNPVRMIATDGQVADVTQGKALISGIEAEHVIADKGYDSDKLVVAIAAGGERAAIPPRKNRKEPREHNKYLYEDQNLTERFPDKVKNCRRVATRYEKTARNYLAF